MSHKPVLLNEVLKFADTEGFQLYIDGTVGDGGYTWEILQRKPNAKVLGIDLDQTSLDRLAATAAQKSLSQRLILVQGNFKNLKEIASEKGFSPADCIILDLGFSSSQLDDEKRGLSFQTDAPLDMRFDLSRQISAKAIVNKYPKEKLTKIFRDYGEEKLAAKIANEIVMERGKQEIATTAQLYSVISQALPKPVVYKSADFARRIFQALRIEVNDELNNLRTVLPEALEVLAPQGTLIVISFHSLEDRIVKEFMVNEAKGCICPPEFPTCVCGKKPRLGILTKKPITASEEEVAVNPRSKPAKMRVAVKKE
jgi:16S rRNA (cytosine1402-N4)-methyltransferase